jgi:hypothetical protein
LFAIFSIDAKTPVDEPSPPEASHPLIFEFSTINVNLPF